MRAGNKPPQNEGRERYLGEIAPLLEAARNVDSLSPDRKRQMRKRILRSAFGRRRWGARSRLTPLFAALGLLAIGSAAFAMAEHWGLLPRLGYQDMGPPVLPPSERPRKHRAARSSSLRPVQVEGVQSAASGVPVPEPAVPTPAPTSTSVPDIPDPLLADPATSPAASPAVRDEAMLRWSAQPPPSVPAERSASLRDTGRRARRRLALVEPRVVAEPRPWTVPSASRSFWSQAESIDSYPDSATQPTAAISPPSPHPAVALAIAAAAVQSQPAPEVPAAPRVAVQPTSKETPSDQALFARAMHRLRSEGNPAAALATLKEHARAYPGSALAGERTSLQIESLLALRRNPEALALLDTLSLDDLPRSGERLVVRGELRAGAKRWSEASADFDRALSRVSGSPAWYERALWGRAASRLRMGEREAGMADMERYLDRFPHGRFANEAARFFPHR